MPDRPRDHLPRLQLCPCRRRDPGHIGLAVGIVGSPADILAGSPEEDRIVPGEGMVPGLPEKGLAAVGCSSPSWALGCSLRFAAGRRARVSCCIPGRRMALPGSGMLREQKMVGRSREERKGRRKLTAAAAAGLSRRVAADRCSWTWCRSVAARTKGIRRGGKECDSLSV